MLQATTRDLETGRKVIIIGLSQDELSALQDNRRAFRIKGGSLGAAVDVVIYHGDTEAHMLEAVSEIITPDTILFVDNALKN